MQMLLTSVPDVVTLQFLTLFVHGWIFTVQQAVLQVLSLCGRVQQPAEFEPAGHARLLGGTHLLCVLVNC